ncbi:MAG: hypothetical protein ACQKBU_12110 [Verrucomicrobiales bacterium]
MFYQDVGLMNVPNVPAELEWDLTNRKKAGAAPEGAAPRPAIETNRRDVSVL